MNYLITGGKVLLTTADDLRIAEKDIYVRDGKIVGITEPAGQNHAPESGGKAAFAGENNGAAAFAGLKERGSEGRFFGRECAS